MSTAERDALAAARALISLAKQAMPDTYFATDRRVKLAKMIIAKYAPKRRRAARP